MSDISFLFDFYFFEVFVVLYSGELWFFMDFEYFLHTLFQTIFHLHTPQKFKAANMYWWSIYSQNHADKYNLIYSLCAMVGFLGWFGEQTWINEDSIHYWHLPGRRLPVFSVSRGQAWKILLNLKHHHLGKLFVCYGKIIVSNCGSKPVSETVERLWAPFSSCHKLDKALLSSRNLHRCK